MGLCWNHDNENKEVRARGIKGCSATLDHEKLGYELTVITEITVSKGKLLEMEREAVKMLNVRVVCDVAGLTAGPP